jgi:hypothetical protein
MSNVQQGMSNRARPSCQARRLKRNTLCRGTFGAPPLDIGHSLLDIGHSISPKHWLSNALRICNALPCLYGSCVALALLTGCSDRRPEPPPALLPDPISGQSSSPVQFEPLAASTKNGEQTELTPAQVLAMQAERKRAASRTPARRRAQPTTERLGRTELLAKLKDLESLPNGRDRMNALLTLGKAMGTENFKNALALAGAVSNPSTRNLLYQGIFAVEAARDPRSALRAAEALAPTLMSRGSSSSYHERRRDHETAVMAALRELSKESPSEAMAYLGKTDSRFRTRARHVVYEGWGQHDHEAALESLNGLTEKEQAALVPVVFRGWAQEDPAAAANYADGLEDGTVKTRIIQNIAQGVLADWDPEDPGAKASWAVNQLPVSAQGTVLTQVYSRWAQTDPAEAADHLMRSGGTALENSSAVLGSITRQWAQQDPDAALAWVDATFTDDAAYVEMVKSVTHGVRYKNPGKAAEILERLPFTYEDDSVGAQEVQGLMAFWSRKDNKAAIAWTDSLEDRQLRVIATKTLASSMASKNFDQAMNWADTIDDPDMQAYALSNIALKQSMQGMKKSDEWIDTLPDGFIRTRTAAGYALGALWRVKDSTSAALVKRQLSQDALEPAELERIISSSNLDAGSKGRLIELLQ